MIELGLYTFVERTPDADGRTISAERRMANLLEEVQLADEVGLDVFGVGEHHRPEYVVSAPAVVLAAAAARTTRIRLTSAVTVLSSDDPVRVFQDFATLDLISGGRAEIMAGRGSFIESFPLFGQDLDDYDRLFSEKLELLLELRGSERVTWPGGSDRAPITDRGVYPRPVQDPLPVWIAVGGTPASVVRAGTLGLPLAIAIIGGEPARFRPMADLYRDALGRAGHDAAAFPVGINMHGFVGDDSAATADLWFGPLKHQMDHIGAERGWGPLTRQGYDLMRGPRGALAVGDPEEVAAKILAVHRVFGNRRFLLQMSVGTLPHDAMLRSIELYGTKVAPLVREALAADAAPTAA